MSQISLQAQSPVTEAPKSTNPRRCRADESVCLRPILQKKQASRSGYIERILDSQHAKKTSPLPSFSSTCAAKLPTSASGSSQSNSASKWFNSANENVRIGGAYTFDNDSPYYLGQRNASVVSEQIANQDPSVFNQRRCADSENEDLRSVIDDLTIKNKRLKRKLKNLQRSPSSPATNDNRLFEVRIHDLPSNRKRELENILRVFASRLNQDHGVDQKNDLKFRSSLNASDTTVTESSSLNTGTKMSNAQSSYASVPHAPVTVKTFGNAPSDSAYYSMSQLGRSSSGATSNNGSFHPELPGPASNASKDKKIHSYLRDIPQSLLPQHNPIMSERTKMKAVVQRLEQLFTGNKAAPGEHSLPLQQQAISDSAAQADQVHALQDNRSIPVEGSREARILSNSTAKATDGDLHPVPYDQGSAAGPGIINSDNVRVTDQRPTRPLDLDMHRAQDAADNIEYIRHLGLSNSPTGTFLDGEPGRWVYLNLLVNMAQLHMLNVTPEFIRKSVSSLSAKLELSSDGRKLRWRGGLHGTAFSSESGSNAECQSESSPERGGQTSNDYHTQQLQNSTTLSGSKNPSDSLHQSKTSDLDSLIRASGQWSGKLNLRTNTTAHPLDYKPLFLKQNSTDSDNSSEFPNEFSNFGGTAETTTVLADSGVNSLSKPKSKSPNETQFQHGPIIFYNNASYFIDLSEDRNLANQPKNSWSASRQAVLGAPIAHTEDFEDLPGATQLSNASEANYNHPLADVSMNLEPLSKCSGQENSPYDFEACGLGGVVPADNFVINVRSCHGRRQTSGSKQVASLSADRRRSVPEMRSKILSSKHINLPPSSLPPPSYIFPFSSISTSNFGEPLDSVLDEGTVSAGSASHPPMIRTPMGRYVSAGNQELDSTDSDVYSDTDDSEIDMLQQARVLDPAAVRQQEQAFEAANMKILGIDVPPGSLAATAGGLESCIDSNATSPGSSSDENETVDDNRSCSLKRKRSDVDFDGGTSKAPRIHVESIES